MSEELKKCPFNQTSENGVIYDGDYYTSEEAIEAWNNRPIEDKLQQRILELEKQLTQQPIETAPTDGTDILLYIEETKTKAGHSIGGGEYLGRYCGDNWQTISSNFIQPTHWLPIPKLKKQLDNKG